MTQSARNFWKSFAYDRMKELISLLILASSAWVLISLISHTPFDPSTNVAIDADIQNWGGEGGSELSSFLFQFNSILSYL